MKYHAQVDGQSFVFEIQGTPDEPRILQDGQPLAVDFLPVTGHLYSLIFERRSHRVPVEAVAGGLRVHIAGHPYLVKVETERDRLLAQAAPRSAQEEGGLVKSLMPGIVTQVCVAPGDRVAADQPLLVIEAMKMENEVAAPVAGWVRDVLVRAGQTVDADQLLMRIQPA